MALRDLTFALPLAFRLALRELRGGLRGFYIFLACLFLGVATIASVGALSASLVAGLTQRGQEILGGDLDLRLMHREISSEEAAALRQWGELSHIATLRAMVSTPDRSQQLLVEAKAIDGRYPLIGTVMLRSGRALDQALASEMRSQDGTSDLTVKYNAVVEATLLTQLGLAVGDVMTLGDINLYIADVIDREPDRLAGGFALGPRILIREAALRASGLWQTGSLINHHYRLRLAPTAPSIDALRQVLEADFPLAGWRIRDRRDASPSVRRSIERVALFLTLVGLTALTVGGVGVGNAISAFLDQRRAAIATLKALGASRAVITLLFIFHIGAIALLAVGAALAFGIIVPMGLSEIIAGLIDLPIEASPSISALSIAALFGLVTAFGFMFVPLGRALQTPVSVLFRGAVATDTSPKAPLMFRLAAMLGLCCVVALSFWISERRDIALWFVVSMALSFLILRLSAWLVQALARQLARRGGVHRRLAMRNIIAPAAPVASVTLSVGLSVILVTTLAMVQGNFDRQLMTDFPERAPSFFALDIQPNQIDDFRQATEAFAGFEAMQAVPMLQAAVLAVNDTPVQQITPPSDIAWFLRGDRGITYADTMPSNTQIVEGQWWPDDYAGPPLLSMDERIARGLGLGIGDRLTVNILGRPLVGEIANLRRIDWGSGRLNFALVFSPNPLRAAPHSYVATVTLLDENEPAFKQFVTTQYRNISLVRVKEAVQSVQQLLNQFSVAIGALSLTAIATSILVLAGALASSRQTRLYEAAVLGAMGARRREILAVFLIEYGFMGFGAAVIGASIGTVTSWAVIRFGLRGDWYFLPDVFVFGVGAACVLALGLSVLSLRQQLNVPWRRILQRD